MKQINILILFLLSPVFLFSQTDTTITALSGFEDAAGNTHLFYQTKYSNLGEIVDTSLFDIYHLNTSNLSDSIFLHGTKITQRQTLPPFDDTDGSIASGLKFFNNDPAQYIYIQKSGVTLSANKIIKSDAGEVFSTSENIRMLYISKQNSNNVYAVLNGLILKSTDGGNTFPLISDTNNIAIDFTPLVFSPFDENVIFGFNNNNQLVKSFDGGKHSFIVHPGNTWNEFSQICFDANQENVYAVTGSTYSYQILESHNQGNSYSWENIAWFPGKINLKTDAENSGSFYYLLGKNLFYSNNYGLTRDTLFSFNGIPLDFYKQKGLNNFYIIYSNRIEKINGSDSQILKYFSINNTLSLFPMNVGNKWVYHYSGYFVDVLPVQFDGYAFTKITADSIINGHHYYYFVSNNMYFVNGWTRIDSVNGQVKFLYENSDNEYPYLDILAPEHSFFKVPYAEINNVVNSDTTLWGKRRLKKHFDFSSLNVIVQEYTQGIGLNYGKDAFDFGESISELQGAVINGVVYGDTVVVGVSENDLTLPQEFKLYQNYPNPFNPATTIKYNLPKDGSIKLVVYDLLGRVVKTLVNEFKTTGFYNVKFDATGFPSGVYIYRLSVVGTATNFVQSRKMILLK